MCQRVNAIVTSRKGGKTMIDNYHDSVEKWKRLTKEAKLGLNKLRKERADYLFWKHPFVWADWLEDSNVETHCGYCHEFGEEWGECECPLFPKYCGSDGSTLDKITSECARKEPRKWRIVELCEEMLVEVSKHKKLFEERENIRE